MPYNIDNKNKTMLKRKESEMASTNKISLKHGYTLTIDENDTVLLKVETEEDNLEFDGIKGNLMDGSDFESHYTDEEFEYTVAEYKSGSLSFLTDWGVDEEAAEAIVKDLTPWFERYAISEEDAIERDIKKYLSYANVRRERIKECAQRIRECRNEISEYEKRIGYETSEICRFTEDLEDIMNKIAELKTKATASHNFKSVEPCYTGGGIYIFFGELADGTHFMADSSFFDVRILNEDASDNEDAWTAEWQDEHLKRDLTPTEAVAFFKQMFKWVKANEPDGNYNLCDMTTLEEELNTLKGDWR